MIRRGGGVGRVRGQLEGGGGGRGRGVRVVGRVLVSQVVRGRLGGRGFRGSWGWRRGWLEVRW